jgi:pentatricopeptide repeat protein
LVHITGLLAEDIAIGNSLVDMYAKCGRFAKAREVFEDLSDRRNTITWNALISGYAKHGCDEEALQCFREMESEGFSPDSVTYACVLKACGSVGGVTTGEIMHSKIERRGLWGRDALVGNALVDMYAKIGSLSTAQRLFERLPSRDTVSWNALIAGYVKHERAEEALRCYEQMQMDGGISANAITYVCGLRACGMIASLENGSKMHRAIEAGGGRRWLLGADLTVANSLIDMYARCGDLAKAQQVFDALDAPDLVSWNMLIAGYAQLEDDSAFRMMERMEQTGTMPDSATFRSALVACNHGGFVDEAERCLILMTPGHNNRVGLGLEHCTCMIELLGRAGQMNKAAEAVARLPFHPDAVMLSTLLGACRKWGNLELGTLAFEQAVWLDQVETAPYMYMYNLCKDSSIRGEMPIPVLC